MNETRSLFVRTLPLFTLLIVAIAWLARPASAARSQTSPDFTVVDAYVEAEMKKLRVPGLALAIVQDDQIVHLQGFGVAGPSGAPVTPQTPFIIGSLSKNFTALAVMQLVEAGKVDLDAPVQRYLPWFRVADLEASASISVRHLLNQTSGFSTKAGRDQPSDLSAGALEQRVRSFRTAQLTQPVGTTYQYSGANYATLGMIVQAVSGQPYETYVQQQIYAPLEMANSFTSQSDAQPHGTATGYRYWFGLPFAADLPYNRASLPQGYLISSAEDMSHYLIAQLNAGRYGNASVLLPTGIAAMQQPDVDTGDSETFYGFGWKVGPTNGVPTLWHDGSVFNFHANMVLIPDGRWGIVILKNAYSLPDEITGLNRLSGIAAGVTNLLVGQQPPAGPSAAGLFIFYAIPLLFVALQLIGMVRSSRVLRLWQAYPERQPRRWLSRLGRIGLPLGLNLLWALLILFGLPRSFGVPLPMLIAGIPDLGLLLAASAVIALVWSILWIVLVFFTLRRTRAFRLVGEHV